MLLSKDSDESAHVSSHFCRHNNLRQSSQQHLCRNNSSQRNLLGLQCETTTSFIVDTTLSDVNEDVHVVADETERQKCDRQKCCTTFEV